MIKLNLWKSLLVCTVTIGLGQINSVSAIVKLPALMGDHAILQRGIPVPIWGWGEPGERIEIVFNGKKMNAITGLDGKWAVKLPATKAGGPYDMTIKGDNKLIVRDILMGDVFVCAGQSNMERGIDRVLYASDIQNSANDQIRQFKVNRKASRDSVFQDVMLHTGWKSASPPALGNFSAVAYFFAKRLNERFNVPIGIINTSYGSSLAEAWISKEGLKDFPAFYTQPKASIEQANPMALYNAMLAPLTNYGIKGILWYQGEFNSRRAYQYRSLLPALIRDWRLQFKQADLPFIIVQLPNYDPVFEQPRESAIAELREAQSIASRLPNTALVVTIETNSNTDLHPAEKKPVGERSALAARKLIYKENIVATGPTFLASVVTGNKIIIKYSAIGGKLKSKAVQLNNFTIAGADHKFVNAEALIKGNTVEVSSPDVVAPLAVRFAWADNPKSVNLYNTEGLPAAPFRTDDWPGITQPKNK